jgi:hypothetical protein
MFADGAFKRVQVDARACWLDTREHHRSLALWTLLTEWLEKGTPPLISKAARRRINSGLRGSVLLQPYVDR